MMLCIKYIFCVYQFNLFSWPWLWRLAWPACLSQTRWCDERVVWQGVHNLEAGFAATPATRAPGRIYESSSYRLVKDTIYEYRGWLGMIGGWRDSREIGVTASGAYEWVVRHAGQIRICKFILGVHIVDTSCLGFLYHREVWYSRCILLRYLAILCKLNRCLNENLFTLDQ